MRKSRKRKVKPEPNVYKASEIKDYLENKFNVVDDGFWSWFFEDVDWGETNTIEDSEEWYQDYSHYGRYVELIMQEFADHGINEIEIENDL